MEKLTYVVGDVSLKFRRDQPGRYLKVISMEIRMDTLTPKAVGSGIILTSAKAFTPTGVEVKQTNINL